MSNTRQEQTTSFAIAIFVAGLAFALTVWIASAAAAREGSDQRLAELERRQALIAIRADSIARYIETLVKLGHAEDVTTLGPRGSISSPGDTLVLGAAGVDSVEIISATIREWADQLPAFMSDTTQGRPTLKDYVVIYSRDSHTIYQSPDLRRYLRGMLEGDTVPVSRARITEAGVDSLLSSLGRIPPGRGHTPHTVFGQPAVFIALREVTGITGVSHVLAGTTIPAPIVGFQRVAPVVAIVLPVLLLVAIVAGYRIAGRPMQPVEQIINEVQAITDGRSLHRRLGVDHDSAELSRLAVTLNEMMQRLETSFTALRTFTADASHELNTPLTVLRADVERAMNTEVPEGERLIALEEALREIRRMTDLVESLLTLARADEGRFDLHRERVDIAALAQDVFETALLLGEDAGLTVKLTMLEHGIVSGDRDRLRQLFLNLVTNAIKYTPAGGRVEISLSRRLDGIAFAVRDTGIGISATDLPHVFERFWRADHSRSRASERLGHGLGLPIGQWIAQAHGGALTATSKMGKGSTFTVTLPLTADSARPEDATVQRVDPVMAERGNPE